jgi:hypothetical protein
MKYNKLLLLLGLLTTIASCSLTSAKEDRMVVKLSSDGKLVSSNTEDDQDTKEVAEDANESPELEISNPMRVREMSLPEMTVPEMSVPEMSVPEMSLPEIPVRNN